MATPLRTVWKVLRWLILAALLLIILLALKKPAPLAPQMASDALSTKSAEFQAKLQQLAEAHQAGTSAEVRIESDEAMAAIAQAGAPPAAPATEPASANAVAAPGIQTTLVSFDRDEVTGQFQADLRGKPVVVTVSGRLGSKDGYVTFSPTAFKVGSLPVPLFLVESTLQGKLSEPGNREKLKLPDFVSSLRVENGQLVITKQPFARAP